MVIYFVLDLLGTARGVGLAGHTLVPSEGEVDGVNFKEVQGKAEVLHGTHLQYKNVFCYLKVAGCLNVQKKQQLMVIMNVA